MSPITTHILDTEAGKPAKGVITTLELMSSHNEFQKIGTGMTDGDGRIKDLLSDTHSLVPGIYRLTFQIKSYFEKMERKSFYPLAQIVFEIEEGKTEEHYHVPLLLSGHGHTTYRGS